MSLLAAGAWADDHAATDPVAAAHELRQMSDDAERNTAISHADRGYLTLRFGTAEGWLVGVSNGALVGSMMGVWFLSISLGNFIGGRVAGLFETFPLPQLFGVVFLTTIAAAVLLAFLVRPIRGLMSGVH